MNTTCSDDNSPNAAALPPYRCSSKTSFFDELNKIGTRNIYFYDNLLSQRESYMAFLIKRHSFMVKWAEYVYITTRLIIGVYSLYCVIWFIWHILLNKSVAAIDVEGYSKTCNFDNTRLSAAVTVTPADVH